MACCIGLMLLASCKKNTAPTLSVFNGVGYATEGTALYSGDEITVGFVATGENLTKMEVSFSQDGTILIYHSEDIEKQANYNFSHIFTVAAVGNVTITGTVTDAVGQTAVCSFNIFCEEKPNTKFLGHYEGNALTTGWIKTEISNVPPMDEEFTDRDVPVTLELAEGENMYEVVGICKINNEEMTCTGTVDGNTVTFEASEESFSYTLGLGDYTLKPEIKMTYNICGTLTNGKLMLNGTCSGHGDINAIIFNGTMEMEATIGGFLTKK